MSLAQAAKAYFDAERAKKTDLSDESFTPVQVNSMLRKPLEELGRVLFKQMMNAFLADSKHAEKAWPFRLFVAIHRNYRTNTATGQNSNHFTDVTNVDPKEWQNQ